MDTSPVPLERRGTLFRACYLVLAPLAYVPLVVYALACFATIVLAPLAIEAVLRLVDHGRAKGTPTMPTSSGKQGGWERVIMAETIALSPLLAVLFLGSAVMTLAVGALLAPVMFIVAMTVPLRDDQEFWDEFRYSYTQALAYTVRVELWSFFLPYVPDVILYDPQPEADMPVASAMQRLLGTGTAERPPAPPPKTERDNGLLEETAGGTRNAHADETLARLMGGRGRAMKPEGDHMVVTGNLVGLALLQSSGRGGSGGDGGGGGGGGNGTVVRPSGYDMIADQLGLGRRSQLFWPCLVYAGGPALLVVAAFGLACAASGLLFAYGAEVLLRVVGHGATGDIHFVDRPVLAATDSWRYVVAALVLLLSPAILVLWVVCFGLVLVGATLLAPLMFVTALFVPITPDVAFLPEFQLGYAQALRFLRVLIPWTLVPLIDPLGHLPPRERLARVLRPKRQASTAFLEPPAEMLTVMSMSQQPMRFSLGAAYQQVLQAITAGRVVRGKPPHVRRGRLLLPCHGALCVPVLVPLTVVHLVLACTGVFLPLGTEGLLRMAEYGYTGDVNFGGRRRLTGFWGAAVMFDSVILSPVMVITGIASVVLLALLSVVMLPVMLAFAVCVPLPDTVDFNTEFVYSYRQSYRFTQTMILWVLLPGYTPRPVSGRRVYFRANKGETHFLSDSTVDRSQSAADTEAAGDPDGGGHPFLPGAGKSAPGAGPAGAADATTGWASPDAEHPGIRSRPTASAGAAQYDGPWHPGDTESESDGEDGDEDRSAGASSARSGSASASGDAYDDHVRVVDETRLSGAGDANLNPYVRRPTAAGAPPTAHADTQDGAGQLLVVLPDGTLRAWMPTDGAVSGQMPPGRPGPGPGAYTYERSSVTSTNATRDDSYAARHRPFATDRASLGGLTRSTVSVASDDNAAPPRPPPHHPAFVGNGPHDP